MDRLGSPEDVRSQLAERQLDDAGISLGVFFALYGTLAVVDVVLMRRFARLDPPSALPSEESPGAGHELLR